MQDVDNSNAETGIFLGTSINTMAASVQGVDY